MAAPPPGGPIGQDMAGPPLRPQGGVQQLPPRPPFQPQLQQQQQQPLPPGAPLGAPPRPFIPGGPVNAPPPRSPLPPRPSGPNSFAPQQLQQQPRPLQPGQPPYPGPPPGVPLQQPLQQGPPRPRGPPPAQFQPQPQQPLQQSPQPPLDKQGSFQRPPAPFLNPASRQSSLASINPPDPNGQIRRPNMEPEGTPPASAKNRSFSIAGAPGMPTQQFDEERRRSMSGIGGVKPEETVSRGPGLAFIKEGVQSGDPKESPLNVGLTRLSKEDISRGSRESVRSDSSEGKGGYVPERPESRLSGSRMAESIVGSLDMDERKNGSPVVRGRNADDDDDVVTHNNNNKPSVQNGSPVPNKSPVSSTPNVTRTDSENKIDSPSRPKPSPDVTAKPPLPNTAVNRPPSAMGNQPEVGKPVRNGTPEPVTARPSSRSDMKPTDLGTPIKTGAAEDKKATPTRRAVSARARREGDNDSGVDESTQGNEHVNGSAGSPGKKSPTKIPGKSGTKSGVVRSPSKSAAHTPNTPDSTTSNTSIEKKKVPMNKVQVGSAPSPNIKAVKSKIGSLENATHRPGGGNIKIENRKLDFNKATPRIAAKNDTYAPGGGDKKITQKKLQWNAKSKIGSLENATHKPGGGDKKIESVKLDFKDKAKPKVASTVNITHKPGGGDVKLPNTEGKKEIENQKLDIKAHSKVGSLDNVKHKPGGGDIKIFDDKEYIKQISTTGHDSVISPPSEDYDDYVSLQDIVHRRRSMGPQSIMTLGDNGSAKTSRPQRPRTARETSAHRYRTNSPRKSQTPRIEYERPPFRIY